MEMHRLPDGGYTKSERRYVREWRKVAAPICKALDVQLTGFDPCFSFRPKDGKQSFQVPAWVAVQLASKLNA